MEYFTAVSQQALEAQQPYRGIVSMLHYGDYILIKSEIMGEVQRRWFHKEGAIFYYYLPKEERIPIVTEMFYSGCTVTEISEMVGLSRSTINNDVNELKLKYGVAQLPQIVAHDVTPDDLILKSTINQKPANYLRENTRWLT